MFKFVLCIFITLFSFNVNAANWHYLDGVLTDNSVTYFDADSIMRKDGAVTVWEKIVYEKNTSNSDGSYSLAAQVVYHCKKRTYQTLTISYYGKNQVFLNTVSTPTKEVPVVPSTLGETSLNLVCKSDFPKGTTSVYKNDVYATTDGYFEYLSKSKNDPAPRIGKWYVFDGAYNDNGVYFFNADSFIKNGDIVTIWVRFNSTPDTPLSDGSYASSFKYQFDCTNKTIQRLMFTKYDKDGSFINSNTTQEEKAEVIAVDTLAAVMLHTVCSPNFPKDATGPYTLIEDGDTFAATKRMYAYLKARKSDPAPK